MLTTLAVENYRSLRRLVMPLRGLNVVTGANGTGKSSLYRALRLLADDRGRRVDAHPPQRAPVLLVVVDEEADLRIRLDVAQPLEGGGALGLVVDGRDDQVRAGGGERDGYDVRAAVGADGGEPCHLCGVDPLAFTGGEGSPPGIAVHPDDASSVGLPAALVRP